MIIDAHRGDKGFLFRKALNHVHFYLKDYKKDLRDLSFFLKMNGLK